MRKRYQKSKKRKWKVCSGCGLQKRGKNHDDGPHHRRKKGIRQ